jgi:hypothetical protein
MNTEHENVRLKKLVALGSCSNRFCSFQMANGPITSVHHWIGLNLGKSGKRQRLERSHNVLLCRDRGQSIYDRIGMK